MDDLFFSSLFAIFGMIFVFLVIAVLTAVMLLMGKILNKTTIRNDRENGLTGAGVRRRGPEPEHLAVIAAAIAVHAGTGVDKIALSGDEDRGAWGTGVLPAQAPGRIQTLRRTR